MLFIGKPKGRSRMISNSWRIVCLFSPLRRERERKRDTERKKYREKLNRGNKRRKRRREAEGEKRD